MNVMGWWSCLMMCEWVLLIPFVVNESEVIQQPDRYLKQEVHISGETNVLSDSQRNRYISRFPPHSQAMTNIKIVPLNLLHKFCRQICFTQNLWCKFNGISCLVKGYQEIILSFMSQCFYFEPILKYIKLLIG